jgi:barstar (barnase inhibitor)
MSGSVWAQYGGGTAIHFTTDAADIVQQLRIEASQLRMIELNAGSFASWEECWSSVGAALGFPDEQATYAMNPNAFLDWLTDLSWIGPLRGLAVILRDSNNLWAQSPYHMGMLVEVWLHAADHWACKETPLHLIFECPT